MNCRECLSRKQLICANRYPEKTLQNRFWAQPTYENEVTLTIGGRRVESALIEPGMKGSLLEGVGKIAFFESYVPTGR